MVRGYYRQMPDGGREWVEEQPDPCQCGGRWLPRWGACPGCGWMGRQWQCSDCSTVLLDPEHGCSATSGGR